MPPTYDVFLSHNSADKAAVEEIATWLRDEAGLRPFLDTWDLVPGEPWMPALELAMERSTIRNSAGGKPPTWSTMSRAPALEVLEGHDQLAHHESWSTCPTPLAS